MPMPKYNLTKVESAIGMAIVVGDYLLLSGSPFRTAIGYAILAGISGYFGKHFISNALASEAAATGATVPKA